jgi:copper chaperone CopZ
LRQASFPAIVEGEGFVSAAGDGIGSEANMAAQTSATLRIGGMSCAACAGRVEDALAGTRGVTSVTVDLAAKSADVTYDPDVATPSALAKAVTDLGYEVVGS